MPAAHRARFGEEEGGRGCLAERRRARSVGAVERRVRIVDIEAGVDANLDRGGIEDGEANQDGEDEKEELHQDSGPRAAAKSPQIDIVN
jgi:hypothetical protein